MFLAEIRRECKDHRWADRQTFLLMSAIEILKPFEGTATKTRYTNPEFAQALADVEGRGFDYFIYSRLETETAGQQSLDLNPFRELIKTIKQEQES